MKITTIGSLGHIGKPLVNELVKSGHDVTVVSSNPGRKKSIEELGATAAIGSVMDNEFLVAAFSGKDAVYTMTPFPAGSYFESEFDVTGSLMKLSDNYKSALEKSGVQKVVHLSSIGADRESGNGILSSYYPVEMTINSLPEEVSITILRPVGFYYNLYGYLDSIRKQGVIATNYGGDVRWPWVSPLDIAQVASEELTSGRKERKVRYVASDEVSCKEIASVLGNAIGKPDLKWILIPDEQVLAGLLSSGMNPEVAKGFVEMNAATRSGALQEDYYRNQPVLGKVKIRDFAKEFAVVYANQ